MTKELLVVEAPRDAATRVQRLIEAFINAPNESDVDLLVGNTDENGGCLVLQIQGTHHPFVPWEARYTADAIETAMHENPVIQKLGVDDLILLLRLGADKAEEIYGQKEKCA